MTKQLSSRQVALMLILAIVANKLIMLPGMISFDARQDMWLAFLISFVIDFLFCMIYLYFSRKLDKPLLQVLEQKYGRIVASFFAICTSIVFLLKTTELFGECYLFFDNVMYVEINRYIFTACFLTFVLYFGSRKLRTVGRTNEIMFFLFVVIMAFCLFLALDSSDYSQIFPICELGLQNIFVTVFKHNIWFGDFLLIFLFVGNMQKDEHATSKIIWSYIIGELIVLTFVILFTATFGKTAQMHRVAIIDMTEYRPRLLSEGRINWVIDLIYPISALIGLGIYSNAGISALDYCTNPQKKTNTVAVLIFSSLLLAIELGFQFSQQNIINMLTTYACYFSAAIQYLMPLCLLLMIQKKEKAK